MEPENESSSDNPPLGSLQKGTIDLAGCSLGRHLYHCLVNSVDEETSMDIEI